MKNITRTDLRPLAAQPRQVLASSRLAGFMLIGGVGTGALLSAFGVAQEDYPEAHF